VGLDLPPRVQGIGGFFRDKDGQAHGRSTGLL
jgi:hypothetical protein